MPAPGGSAPDWDISTGPMSFTFLPNRRYDIVVARDAGDIIGRWDQVGGEDAFGTAMNGFESLNNNSNNVFAPFGSGQSYAGVDPRIRLFSGSASAEAPVPAALPLLAAALAVPGLTRARRAAA